MEEAMQQDDFGRDSATAGQRSTGGLAQTANEALSRTAALSQQAADKARQAAAETASTVTSQVKGLLDSQVGSGAEMIGHVADSARLAARDLEQNAPQIAGIVRGVAERMDDYADDLRDQSVEDLLRAASDLTRRQPALVFGLAALAGFFAFRTIKHSAGPIASPSIQPDASPSIQPAPGGFHAPAGSSHGV